MSEGFTLTRRRTSTRRKVLTAAAILQLLMAQPEGAHASEWKEPGAGTEENLEALHILKKMYRDGTAVRDARQPVFFGAYRVMTSGAA